jgi:hypothetical protein
METNNGTSGGLLIGKTDKNNGDGIEIIAPEGKIRAGGGEIIINEQDSKENCEILSEINSKHGVQIPCDKIDNANTSKMEYKDGGEILIGGKADNKTLQDIADKHNEELSDIEFEFKTGVEHEMEHTNDQTLAQEIAKDHLWEDPSYYVKLAKIENKDVNLQQTDIQMETINPKHIKEGTFIIDNVSNLKYEIQSHDKDGFTIKRAGSIEKGEPKTISYDELKNKWLAAEISIASYNSGSEDDKFAFDLMLKNIQDSHRIMELGGIIDSLNNEKKEAEKQKEIRKRKAKAMALNMEYEDPLKKIDQGFEQGGKILNDKYFIFGTAVIKGQKENVYLNNEGKLKQDVSKDDLMLFNSSKEAYEYTEEKGMDLADWDKLSNYAKGGKIKGKKKGRPKKNIELDKKYKAKKPGKRESVDGNVYYENRENRSDKNRKTKI